VPAGQVQSMQKWKCPQGGQAHTDAAAGHQVTVGDLRSVVFLHKMAFQISSDF